MQKRSTIPESDRTLIIPERVYFALEDMAADERKKVKGKGVIENLKRSMITPKSLAQQMLAKGVLQKTRGV